MGRRKTFAESKNEFATFLKEWMKDQRKSTFAFRELKCIAHYRGQEWLLESALHTLIEQGWVTWERDLNLIYLIDTKPQDVV